MHHTAGPQKSVALRKESVDRNISDLLPSCGVLNVALRKESVDRNRKVIVPGPPIMVALRKESVDRNPMGMNAACVAGLAVALRKESVDRNGERWHFIHRGPQSLSARRAWIEIRPSYWPPGCAGVALRKESVDRNVKRPHQQHERHLSLSARRAWIEIANTAATLDFPERRSPQGERG